MELITKTKNKILYFVNYIKFEHILKESQYIRIRFTKSYDEFWTDVINKAINNIELAEFEKKGNIFMGKKDDKYYYIGGVLENTTIKQIDNKLFMVNKDLDILVELTTENKENMIHITKEQHEILKYYTKNKNIFAPIMGLDFYKLELVNGRMKIVVPETILLDEPKIMNFCLNVYLLNKKQDNKYKKSRLS